MKPDLVSMWWFTIDSEDTDYPPMFTAHYHYPDPEGLDVRDCIGLFELHEDDYNYDGLVQRAVSALEASNLLESGSYGYLGNGMHGFDGHYLVSGSEEPINVLKSTRFDDAAYFVPAETGVSK